jgi:hypothetical protein
LKAGAELDAERSRAALNAAIAAIPAIQGRRKITDTDQAKASEIEMLKSSKAAEQLALPTPGKEVNLPTNSAIERRNRRLLENGILRITFWDRLYRGNRPAQSFGINGRSTSAPTP